MGIRSSRHIDSLDALRGVAIVLVLFFHLTPAIQPGNLAETALHDVAKWGWVGVDLFFVLSGFLITGILLDTRESPGYFRNFYARRALRIFPLYFGALLILSLIPHAIEGYRIWAWTYTLNFFMAWRGSPEAPLIGHFWTLCVEEHFYLIWPLVVFVCSRKVLKGVGWGIVVCALILRTALVLSHKPIVFPYVLTPCRMDELAFGGLLAIYVREHSIEKIIKPAGLFLGLCGAVLLVVIVRGLGSEMVTAGRVMTAGISLFMVGSGSLLILAIARPFWINWRVLRVFGKYSYGLYVIHYPMIALVFDRVSGFRTHPDEYSNRSLMLVLYLVVTIGFSLVAAVASWHLFESRFLKLKRYFEYSGKTEERVVAQPTV